MDSYPVSSQLLENVPEPLIVGVLGGVGFMGLALAVLLGSACVVSRKMGRRCKQEEDGNPPRSRESGDTHFDELHHEYNNLFNKILKALLLHYINHTTPLHGSAAPPFSRSPIQLLKLLMSFTLLAN